MLKCENLFLSVIVHCVKSVHIRSYSGSYFPVFGLNTDQNNSEYGHFLCSGICEKVSIDGVTLFNLSSSDQDQADTKVALHSLQVWSSSPSNVCIIIITIIYLFTVDKNVSHSFRRS